VTIDAYLVALRRLLPRSACLRVLPEIREHLRDATARYEASGLSPFEAEATATRDFGPVEEVARRTGAELAVRETRRAAVLAFAATVLFVFPLYAVPEYTMPPGPRVLTPADIAALQQIGIGLWVVACVLSMIGVAIAWTRWSRIAPFALLSAAVAVAGSIGATAVLAERWFSLTPATPNWALSIPLALASLSACLGAGLWARACGRRPMHA
jgi:hypothetical protein